MSTVNIVTYTDYLGPYTVTPSNQQQTLATKDKKASDDVTVLALSGDFVLVEDSGDSLIIS